MHISDVKRELYNELKSKEPFITGAGIKEADGIEVIVIYIPENYQQNYDIPDEYKGIRVITEISDDPRLL